MDGDDTYSVMAVANGAIIDDGKQVFTGFGDSYDLTRDSVRLNLRLKVSGRVCDNHNMYSHSVSALLPWVSVGVSITTSCLVAESIPVGKPQ